MSANNPYAVPAAEAAVEERVTFLRKVAGLTFVGLCISGATSMAMAGAIALAPGILGNQIASMVLMLGGIFGARFVGSSMVYGGESATTQYTGFVLGTMLQGVAMGYLLLTALLFSANVLGNPLMLLFEAIGLVTLTMFGMTVYLLTGPKKLSMIGGFLSAVSLPMMVLMVVSFAFPGQFGGVMGLILNVVFVGISAAGLLYSLNNVMHRMSTNMVVPAAYAITLGILTLLWNILTLLMRLQRR
jgi:FtsH-binding integral membrane protein